MSSKCKPTPMDGCNATYDELESEVFDAQEKEEINDGLLDKVEYLHPMW